MPSPSTHWLVCGSGPSASRWPVPEHPDGRPWRVATCNAASRLHPSPDLFGAFELNAGMKCQTAIGRAGQASLSGHPQLSCVRPLVASMLGLSAGRGIMVVDHNFGPPELRDLHEDVEWGSRSRWGKWPDNLPDYGQRRSWISSGVLMLWLVAEVYRPAVIAVAGLDGYPTDRLSNHRRHPDYAANLPDLATTKAPWDTDPEEAVHRREQMNDRMALGIERITNHYRDIRFIWLQRANHHRPGWRVEVAGESVPVGGLYRGFVQDTDQKVDRP